MSSPRTDLIVMGASAGAVDVLGTILPALPSALPVPVVVVVHIPAGRPNMLPGLFSDRCQLRVKEVEDKEILERGTIYFAPPDYHVLVERDLRSSLDTDDPVNFSRPSIDVLFESAARARGPAVLGVLLTGASRDGARGLAAIKARGGVTVVQDPETAVARHMPEAGIAAAAPNHVLAPAGIAPLLARISSNLP